MKYRKNIAIILFAVSLLSVFFAGTAAADTPFTSQPSVAANDASAVISTADGILEERYIAAKKKLYNREFHEARELFVDLGAYKDSEHLAEECLNYPLSEPLFKGTLINDEMLDITYPKGKLYNHNYYGMFYIPDEVNEKTTFVLYHSGGGGLEDYLYYSGVYRYFDNYFPNSIIFFTNNSGYNRIELKNREMYAILQQLAYECGTIVHDVSLVGSSSGCYTAMKAVISFYQDYGIKVTNVCCLDVGLEWNDSQVLRDWECDIAAETGTVFYLFEQQEVGMNFKPIRLMVDHGVNTYVIICKDDNHNNISANAYVHGIFSWSGGDESIILPESEYYFVKLKQGMKENPPAQFSHPEDPKEIISVYDHALQDSAGF